MLGLFIRSDNSFEVHVDGEKKASGSLLKDMQPPVNPPKETRLHDSMNVFLSRACNRSEMCQEIDDPSDQKPSNWVDEAKIDDPDASKPDSCKQSDNS